MSPDFWQVHLSDWLPGNTAEVLSAEHGNTPDTFHQNHTVPSGSGDFPSKTPPSSQQFDQEKYVEMIKEIGREEGRLDICCKFVAQK